MPSTPSQPDGQNAQQRRGGPFRRFAQALLFLAALVLIHDLMVQPQAQWSNRALLSAIDLYQATASPVLPAVGVQCRFSPTCSRYSEAVLRRYGVFGGGARAAWRILRCGPWTPRGTVDPPAVQTAGGGGIRHREHSTAVISKTLQLDLPDPLAGSR